MRFAVFVFSLVLVVMPAYVHAIVFVPAITGALVRTAGGAVIKVANKKTLAGVAVSLGVPFAIDYCKKNKQKCKDAIGDVAEWFFDDDTNQVCHYNGKQFASADDVCAYFFKEANSRNHQGYVFADRYKATNGMCLVYGGTNKYNGNAGASFNCTDKSQAISQHTQKIIQYAKDNDPDYIINNYGDTINIEQYCSAHACDELTAEFGDEVMKNRSKYDIDKINKANCEVENNKIKSCKNAKKDKDEQETEQTEQTDEQQTEGQGDKGDQDPIECDASAFHKKVCDFIDWYQDDTDLDDDTKVKVTDLSDELQLDKNRIKFTAQCPADKTFKMAYAGVEVNPSISYRWLCDAFIMMKPFIIGLSGISAVLIITGGRRG